MSNTCWSSCFAFGIYLIWWSTCQLGIRVQRPTKHYFTLSLLPVCFKSSLWTDENNNKRSVSVITFQQLKKKKKKELKILLSTAQNNKTLYSFVGAWCWPFQTFRMPRMVRNTQVVRLHASVLSLKEIKPSNEARYVFRIHIQQATHNQLESFTITEKNTNTKKELAWNRRRSFPSAPSTLENTTIFVNWHLFQAYQAWTKNICSAKAVSFAQQRPKALTRLFFLTRSWPWLSWLGRPSSHCWDSAGCWEKK